jgi:hypothetical protein
LDSFGLRLFFALEDVVSFVFRGFSVFLCLAAALELFVIMFLTLKISREIFFISQGIAVRLES